MRSPIDSFAPPARVAVLGATGCVGRHLCTAFAARGSDVLAVARRPAQHLAAHRFEPLDLAATDPERLAGLLAARRTDVVVNATLGWGDDLLAVNVGLVERLLEALRLMPAPQRPRLVQLGTIHEYGPCPYGTSVTERTRPEPQAPYPRAKLTASRLVLDAVQDGTVDATVLRMANTIGPHPARQSFLGSLAFRLAEAGPDTRIELTVADARRDYVDVRDAADAVVRSACRPRPARHDALGPVVNVGRGEAPEIAGLVRTLVAATGLPPEVVRTRRGEIVGQGGDWIMVDPSRARRLLGWRPRYGIEASVRAMWDTVRTDAVAGGAG
ncbi:NAD-dependent epimerase/dehydratase family protein [Streptomyces sp. NBC_00986]|uniref:NAD-dependent epimerase/dehydratase family protein n=1 Tax=Streptomyces sp. NBC_00986 TaxID=2903702 RepID=UPI00386F9ACA|nr:NAD(P)-dependent oxidoreductase [Streptomyces sp. NBC_00986]WSX64485.1 NAD(P)-dependent oxidoreductase [Streptomyces sp. NBC_00986]